MSKTAEIVNTHFGKKKYYIGKTICVKHTIY